MVEGQRHAVVAGLGDEGDRILQPVVGGAIGVVGEAQRHAQAAFRFCISSWAEKVPHSRYIG